MMVERSMCRWLIMYLIIDKCFFPVSCICQPCQNGGHCEQSECVCVAGFTGKTCESEIEVESSAVNDQFTISPTPSSSSMMASTPVSKSSVISSILVVPTETTLDNSCTSLICLNSSKSTNVSLLPTSFQTTFIQATTILKESNNFLSDETDSIKVQETTIVHLSPSSTHSWEPMTEIFSEISPSTSGYDQESKLVTSDMWTTVSSYLAGTETELSSTKMMMLSPASSSDKTETSSLSTATLHTTESSFFTMSNIDNGWSTVEFSQTIFSFYNDLSQDETPSTSLYISRQVQCWR